MAQPVELEKLTGVASRFGAFVAERFPFALIEAMDAGKAQSSNPRQKHAAATRRLAASARSLSVKHIQLSLATLEGMIAVSYRHWLKWQAKARLNTCALY